MKITFKTGGIMADILPHDAVDEKTLLEISSNATTVDVMKQLGLPEDDFYLVILNDAVVPKADRDTIVLKEADELGIFPPLKGG